MVQAVEETAAEIASENPLLELDQVVALATSCCEAGNGEGDEEEATSSSGEEAVEEESQHPADSVTRPGGGGGPCFYPNESWKDVFCGQCSARMGQIKLLAGSLRQERFLFRVQRADSTLPTKAWFNKVPLRDLVRQLAPLLAHGPYIHTYEVCWLLLAMCSAICDL